MLARAESLSCADVADTLAGILDDKKTASAPVIAHVEHCLSCQSELAQYRRLLRVLHQLSSDELTPQPGVISDVLVALEKSARQRIIRSVLSGRRVAYFFGLLGVAGATAAIVLVTKSRATKTSGSMRNRAEQLTT